MPGPPQKEIIRLLPSELNLLPPGDKAAPGALELQNWRVDQAGVLRSRRGQAAEASGFGGPFHTLFRWDTQRYGITGDALHKGPTMSSYLGNGFSGEPCTMLAYQGLTWIMDRAKPSKTDGDHLYKWSIDPPAAAPTATAGGRVKQALASFDSSEAWDVISNDGQTNKYITETKREQISAAGTVAVTNGSATIVGTGTAFNSGMVGKNISIYDGSDSTYSVIATVTDATHLTIIVPVAGPTGSALAYEITDDSTTVTPTKIFDATNKTQGTHSLRMVCTPGGRWSAVLDGISKDTRIAGGAPRGDDEFRIQFYASDPANVQKVGVTLMNGSGGARSYVFAEIDGSVINPARYTWQELSISRGVGALGFSGDAVWSKLNDQYQAAAKAQDWALASALLTQMNARQDELRALQVRFSGSDDFDWTAVTEIQVDVYLSDASDIHLDEAYFVGGVSSSLSGTFYYAVSFDNDFGHESTIGPYSAAVTLDKQGAGLASIPVSADPQVTAKHVYRIGGGVDAPLRVTTLANSATTWTDTITVEEQQANAIAAQLLTDPAPQAWGAVQHGGRIVAWQGNRLYWSETAKPWSFPGSGDDFEGNWVDVGQDGEDIVTCTSRGNQLRIYKAKTIWRVLGDPDADGVEPELVWSDFGAVGIRGVVEAGALDYLVYGEGVAAFNGDSAKKISMPVDPLWKGDYPALTTSSFRAPVEQDSLATCALGYINGRLYVSYPEAGQATPNRTLVYDVDGDRWFDHSGGFRCFFYEGQGATLIAGTQAGAVMSLEQGLLDGSAALPLRWRTAYLDQGAPDNLKRYSDLVIEFQTAFGAETGPATLNVSLALDNGATVLALGTMSSAARNVWTFTPTDPDAWQGKNFSLLVDGSSAKTCVIYAAYLHYTVLPRRGCSFDSDIIDLGSRLLKLVEAVEIDVAASASTTLLWSLQTDWPDGAMAERASATASIAAGRRTITLPIPPGVEGRRLRFRYTSPGCPQLYGVRLKYKTRGELIEGGQTWVSPLLDLRELNVFAAIELVADTTASVRLVVSTELPGYDMAARTTLTFDTTTTGRAPVLIALGAGTKGKLLQVVLTPQGSAVLRLFSVRVWARNFDKSSGGAWRWLTLFSAPDTVGAGEDSKWADLEVRN